MNATQPQAAPQKRIAADPHDRRTTGSKSAPLPTRRNDPPLEPLPGRRCDQSQRELYRNHFPAES